MLATVAPNVEQVRVAVSPIVLSKACPPVKAVGFNANNETNLFLEPVFRPLSFSFVILFLLE